MVDGAALLMSLFHSMSAIGMWREEAGVNLLDSGTPFYDAYRTSDGKWIAIGCLEPQFYAEWLRIAGLDGEDLPAQFDIAGWPVLRERFAQAVSTRTRDEWAALADADSWLATVRRDWQLDEAMSPEKLREYGGEISGAVVKNAVNVLGGVLGFFLNSVFLVFVLFFLYRDGGKLGARFVDLVPLPRDQTLQLAGRTEEIGG
jgi:hypothetical protein